MGIYPFIRHHRLFFLLFFLGLLIRLILIPNPGFEADVSFWKSWGLAPFDKGVVWSLYNTNNNYPAPFAYVLMAMTWVYSLFADPHNFNQFWSNTNILFLTLSKLPSIISDLGIALLLYFGLTAKKPFGLPTLSKDHAILLSGIYLFSPLALLDGALWGQVDSFGVVLFLLALFLVLKKQFTWGGAVFILSMMMKLQTMIYGPLFFLFIFLTFGIDALFKSIVGAISSFTILNLEFFLGKASDRILISLIGNADYFPLLSLNAYNPWWIIANAKGMEISDKILSIGILNAKRVGLILFSSTYLFAVVSMIQQWYINQKKKSDEETGVKTLTRSLFFGLIVIVGGFFLFQTQSHDRYAFPIAIFALFFLSFLWEEKREGKKEKMSSEKNHTLSIFLSLFGYILFTGVYFINVHNALIVNYPQNGLPLLFLTKPSVTLFLSFLQTALFLFFVFFASYRQILFPLFSSLLFIALLLAVGNIPLITKQPLSLTKLTPWYHRQDWGKMTIDMPVNAVKDIPKTWNRLSTQYLFAKKGIGTHANSTIIYDVGRHFSKFSANVGIDTEAGSQGSVVFAVHGDGKLLVQSPKMGRFDTPVHIEADITGVKDLMLVVWDAGNGNVDDHADWMNPTIR